MGVAEKSKIGKERWRKLHEEKLDERGVKQVGKHNKKDRTGVFSSWIYGRMSVQEMEDIIFVD